MVLHVLVYFILLPAAMGLAISACLLRRVRPPACLRAIEPNIPEVAPRSLLEGALGLALGGLLIWIPYGLMRRSPRRWWLYTALLSLPAMFFFMLVEPIWVAPLFHHFGPMHDKQLEAQILALADEAGIEGGRVFEAEHEHGHQRRERLRDRSWGQQADRALGHAPGKARRPRGPRRHGARDGTLCTEPCDAGIARPVLRNRGRTLPR